MSRIRHYRRFVVVTAVCLFAVYHLSQVQVWNVPNVQGLRQYGSGDPPKDVQKAPVTPQESKTVLEIALPEPLSAASLVTASPKTTPHSSTSDHGVPTLASNSGAFGNKNAVDGIEEEKSTAEAHTKTAQERLDLKVKPSEQAKIHWQRPEEHFAVPSASLKTLPTGSPRALNRVQFAFLADSTEDAAERLHRQQTVKASFKHGWDGYATLAMSHDVL